LPAGPRTWARATPCWQERSLLTRGTEDLVEADLPSTTWDILVEWRAAAGKLNRALRSAGKRAGVPPSVPHAVSVRQLPLAADVLRMG
jgi:hypothetical protein